MTLLIILVIAAIILFGIGLGTTLKWLLIIAAVLFIAGLISGFMGRRSRT